MLRQYGFCTLGFSLSFAFLTLGCSDDSKGSGATLVDAADGEEGSNDREALDDGESEEFACETNKDCQDYFGGEESCKVALCNAVAKTCFVGEKKDFSTCDDGNACTSGEYCLAGECSVDEVQTLDCTDGDPCTDDLCDEEKGCIYQANTADCNDGNPCTSNDS